MNGIGIVFLVIGTIILIVGVAADNWIKKNKK
jgi:hypothetical protein